MVESVRQDEFATRDPDQAHAWLSKVYADHQVKMWPAENFLFTSSSVSLDEVTIGMLTHTGPVEIVFPAGVRRPLVFQQQARDGLVFSLAGSVVEMHRGDSLMLPPERACEVEWSGLSAITTTLSLDALRRDALGFAPDNAGSFRIDFGRPLSAAAGQHWSATTHYVLSVVTRTPLLASAPLACRELIWMINSAVLACFPNSTLDIETRTTSSESPLPLRRALAFIEEHAGDPITLTEIARAAGLSPRGLQASFRRNVDTTPLAYLRAVRMQRAHRDLLSADPTTGMNVAAVAARWGFTHLGRFATEYRRRFNAYPSQTLRSG